MGLSGGDGAEVEFAAGRSICFLFDWVLKQGIKEIIMQDIVNGRCGWCGTDELYVKYHDQEWGNLVTDDKTLFEFLVLESAQAGLSWITILRKRAAPVPFLFIIIIYCCPTIM